MMKNYDAARPTPIGALPDTVLEHIFQFLDAKSLVKLTLVSKRFNQIVSTSSRVMKNLPLVVSCHNESLMSFTRKYQKMILIAENLKSPVRLIFKVLKECKIETVQMKSSRSEQFVVTIDHKKSLEMSQENVGVEDAIRHHGVITLLQIKGLVFAPEVVNSLWPSGTLVLENAIIQEHLGPLEPNLNLKSMKLVNVAMERHSQVNP